MTSAKATSAYMLPTDKPAISNCSAIVMVISKS
jgi:hypothetical protein